MISSQKPVEIVSYLLMDRRGEGFGHVRPNSGQKFILYPWSWFEDHSYPFIEIQQDGTVVKTINCADVAEIQFREATHEPR
jgi:hypothetical protein